MIKINLLPFRVARSRENVRRQLSVFFLLLVFLGLSLLFFYMSKKSHIGTLKTKLASVDSEMTKYKKIGDEIEEIKKKLEIVNKKMSVIDQLETQRFEPATLLAGISDAIVKGRMWLDNVTDQQNSVKISGVAMDEKTVADFMVQLEKLDRFAGVGLSTLKKKTFKDNIDFKVFELLCSKKNAPTPPVEEAKKK